jgi:hypothetical protein
MVRALATPLKWASAQELPTMDFTVFSIAFIAIVWGAVPAAIVVAGGRRAPEVEA